MLTLAHLMIDYSANMDQRTDMGQLCDILRRAAIETGVFPMPGLRIRAIRADYVSIADGDPAHGYIDISVRLRGGRPDQAKADATAHIFAAAQAYLEPVMKIHPIALSLEMRDIDPYLSPKLSSIRDYLGKADDHV